MCEENDQKNGITRRAFLRSTSLTTGVILAGSVSGWRVLTTKVYGADRQQSGIIVNLNTHQTETMNMIADTIIPNVDGQPGAIESDALSTLQDPYYGIVSLIPLIVLDIDAATRWRFGNAGGFKKQDLGTRTKILEERLGMVWWSRGSLFKQAYEGIIMITKTNFFGGLMNSVGTDYIGFPGPSLGYSP